MGSTPADDAPMRRVLLVGCGGAGKSTLARRLGVTRLLDDRDAENFPAALGTP
jgi:GTPase SAR1 family protein